MFGGLCPSTSDAWAVGRRRLSRRWWRKRAGPGDHPTLRCLDLVVDLVLGAAREALVLGPARPCWRSRRMRSSALSAIADTRPAGIGDVPWAVNCCLPNPCFVNGFAHPEHVTPVVVRV